MSEHVYIKINKARVGFISTLLFLFISNWAIGQKYIIQDIFISGNDKTKKEIIQRELTFSTGDSLLLSELTSELDFNKTRLLGTTLFNKVSINISKINHDEKKIEISILVTESWYIYPILNIELADRNFNIWWKDFNHDLKRLNYVTGLHWRNVSGNNDPLKIKLQFGFSQKIEFEYISQFLDKNKKWRLYFNILRSRNKELGIKTNQNKLEFIRDDGDRGSRGCHGEERDSRSGESYKIRTDYSCGSRQLYIIHIVICHRNRTSHSRTDNIIIPNFS